MTKQKKIIIAVCCVALISILSISIFWNNIKYEPLLNSAISSKDTTLQKASEEAVKKYIGQYEKWYLPPNYQVQHMEIINSEVLDEQNKYVQVDYAISFRFSKSIPSHFANDNFRLFKNEDGSITGQLVVKLKNNSISYIVEEVMTPVQYQLYTDKSLREPVVNPYEMEDKDETYYFDKNILYVTYDHGKNFKEVDVEYEDLASANNLQYDQYLRDGSYIVSSSFTAFLANNYNTGFYLVYSFDQGETWNTSIIAPHMIEGSNVNLMKTENYYYISYAVDRSLGHDYYAIKKSSDLKTWEFVDTSSVSFDQYSSVLFTSDTSAYIAPIINQQENGPCKLYYTNDNFSSIQEITLPLVDSVVQKLGYNPFINIEHIYQEDDKIYVIVNQGTSGDYGKDGYIVKALYQSNDGINFQFVKEFDNSKTLAG